MPLATSLPLPVWLRDMPEGVEKKRAELKFKIRIAAIYASRSGNLSTLSRLCGKNQHTIHDMMYEWERHDVQNPAVPPLLAKAIEKAAGPDIVTREMLAPEVFGD